MYFFQRSITNPLNVITLSQTKNDNINLIITIKCEFNQVTLVNGTSEM